MSELYPTASVPMPTPHGTVHYVQPFCPESAAADLRKAMKGFGTDEKKIIKIITSHCTGQRCAIEKKYKQMYGRDLRHDLDKELSGHFEDTILRLFDPPRVFDAIECNHAIQGIGTNEDTLIEILTTRSNSEIQEIRAQYKAIYKRELERDISADTSGAFRRLLVALVSGRREERTSVDVYLAKKEARELYEAGEKNFATEESTFHRILCLRSQQQLKETFSQYRTIARKSIEESITSEMVGNLQEGYLAIVQSAQNTAAFYAERLYKSMKGIGTDDRALIRQVISRSEVDMKLIKDEFFYKYNDQLKAFIKDDTSGDYKKTLLGLIEDKGSPKGVDTVSPVSDYPRPSFQRISSNGGCKPHDSGVQQHRYGSGVQQQSFSSGLQQECVGSGLQQRQVGMGLQQECHGSSGLQQSQVSSGLQQECRGSSGLQQSQVSSGLQQECRGSSGLQQSQVSSELQQECGDIEVQQSQVGIGLQQECHGSSGLQQSQVSSGLRQEYGSSRLQQRQVSSELQECGGNGLQQEQVGIGLQQECGGSGMQQGQVGIARQQECGGSGLQQEQGGSRVQQEIARLQQFSL